MTLPAFHCPTPLDMRRSMGRFTTGVAVVSADDGSGEPSAMTISSLTSISLEPAILLVSLTQGSRTTDAVEGSGRFAVSILSSRQEALARRFATRGGARFDGMPYDVSQSGLPLIQDALTQLECRVHTAHDIGDHRVFYGEVTDMRWRDGTGLVFYSGRFGDFLDFGHDQVPWLY
ncbi:flavin reductase family protein [Nocardia australiensis]|uniref:flavin reductase family protein n=1 Tax=Nocardia australiensis TaxID=2887191 RepID=UPI001D1506E4|nr:flavin reductase family protein [Nocardia australiensis]